ncbi:MAG: glycosyltransferase [Chthoniobacterales bacterium]|nr:glycosyltransferase [Chthoniobacterales bacterium]
MKIAFLSSFAHLALDEKEERVSGGAELQIALLAREIANRAIPTVLLSGNTGQADNFSLAGVRIRNAGNFHTGHFFQMLSAAPRLFTLLKEEKPDWVCVLGWTAWLFYLWFLRKFLGFRLAFICGLDTEVNGEFRRENPLRGTLFEFAMRNADARFAMTLHQQQLFHARRMSCGFYRNLILPRKKPLVSEKKVDFLWVARCRKIKNPTLFVRLAEVIPEASFWMICPPEDRLLFEKVQQAASALPNLTLWQSVPYHQIQDYYDAARIFVNTSEWEGWPNSFIQAGLGRAAILSWKVKPDMLFIDFSLGFCAEGNWSRFLFHANSLFQNPQLTEKCGREAERFVIELHDNKRETDSFLKGLETFWSKNTE